MGRHVSKTNGFPVASFPVEAVPLKHIIGIKAWPRVPNEVTHEQEKKFVFKVRHLKNLIRKGAVLPPIVIDNLNGIFDGQCRFEAHRQLGKKTIMCMRKYED